MGPLGENAPTKERFLVKIGREPDPNPVSSANLVVRRMPVSAMTVVRGEAISVSAMTVVRGEAISVSAMRWCG